MVSLENLKNFLITCGLYKYSSTKKTDDITEILLKVALNTTKPSQISAYTHTYLTELSPILNVRPNIFMYTEQYY
jgi:hypothetical protein